MQHLSTLFEVNWEQINNPISMVLARKVLTVRIRLRNKCCMIRQNDVTSRCTVQQFLPFSNFLQRRARYVAQCNMGGQTTNYRSATDVASKCCLIWPWSKCVNNKYLIFIFQNTDFLDNFLVICIFRPYLGHIRSYS